jgi:serine/threonine protein kinase
LLLYFRVEDFVALRLVVPPPLPRSDRKYLYMLLEYVVGGEFFTHLRKVGRFENNTAKFYAAQVAMIFDYLHRQVCSRSVTL